MLRRVLLAAAKNNPARIGDRIKGNLFPMSLSDCPISFKSFQGFLK